MIRALYTAASGMSAQQLNLDTIANNLANSSTTGFRQLRLEFQDMVYQNLVTPGAAQSQSTVSAGLQIGLGTKSAATEVINTQGSLNETDNPLDLAIEGTGFFQVQRPDGTIAYTRAGQFQLDMNGNIVNSSGYPLQPQITIPADAQQVTIAQDGTVSYTLPNQTAVQQAGQIQLANFQNPAGLNSLGGGLYEPTDASGTATVGVPGGPDGMGSLLQGYVEQSNVSIVNEFINLIQAQRGYEANSKVVTAADNMYQQVNNLAK